MIWAFFRKIIWSPWVEDSQLGHSSFADKISGKSNLQIGRRIRVARFLCEKSTKSTQNVPNGHKIGQKAIKYSKRP
jgi:hypothetical protein